MNIGFKHRLDEKIEASAHGKSTFFFCYYGEFQSMAELRCTPMEYGISAIVRVTNDAQPDESSSVGNFANNADEDRGFFEQKWGCFSRNGKIGGFRKNMITGIKKTHKTTEIYFDEANEWTIVRTYNTSLKNRLLAFSKEYPDLCELIDDDECGCLSFRIQKKYFTYRISAPFSEERKALAREKMQELNARK